MQDRIRRTAGRAATLAASLLIGALAVTATGAVTSSNAAPAVGGTHVVTPNWCRMNCV